MNTHYDLLTAEEYALLIRRSLRTVYRDLASGTGCRAIKVGRRILFRRSDAENYLDECSYSGERKPRGRKSGGEGCKS